MFTAKVTRRKLIGAGVVIGLLLCAIVVAVAARGNDDESALASVTVADNEARVAYLASLGWDVAADPIVSEEVRLPPDFDEVYLRYNALQEEAGFDLNAYKNKRVMHYAYEVLNYPTGQQDVRLNLLVYKNRVIGGDVMSLALDGFMHGLVVPG